MNRQAAAAVLKRDRGAAGLACPQCGSTATLVTDSRSRGGRIWRRRMCRELHRFSTVEIVEDGGRTERLNGLVALIDGLAPTDFALVAGLAARLAHSLPFASPHPSRSAEEGVPSPRDGIIAPGEANGLSDQTARPWEAAAGQGSGEGGEEAPPGPVPLP